MRNKYLLPVGIVSLALTAFVVQTLFGADAPKVGEKAKDFDLQSVTAEKVELSKVLDSGPVVLVVLRGFPGYQCPICSRQVGQLLGQAEKFKAAGTQVLLVYPGPSSKLADRAKEFIKDKTIPDHFRLLLDPDYKLVNQYGLRWNASGETAYPSTFVIQPDKTISFAKVSRDHDGRTSPEEILKQLNAR